MHSKITELELLYNKMFKSAFVYSQIQEIVQNDKTALDINSQILHFTDYVTIKEDIDQLLSGRINFVDIGHTCDLHNSCYSQQCILKRLKVLMPKFKLT